MRRRNKGAAALLAAVALGGCAARAPDQRVRMPGALGGEETRGEVVLVFSDEVRNLTVAVNGELVADRLETRRLTIEGVEVGYADLAIAASSVERGVRVWVSPERATFVPIAVARRPERTHPALSVALSLVALVISQGVNEWLF